jgi:thymidylate kinase
MTAVHPLLAEVFTSLDNADIAWCLLRGEAALAAPTGDIDLLVAPHQMAAMETALAPLTVVPVERWGIGGHRMFFGYHPATDLFIELDVEPELDYGPQASFLVNWLQPSIRTGVASACLARRRRVGDVWILHPDDAFWSLLLHCIVDKAAVAERHRMRLMELAGEAADDGPFGSLVGRICPLGWDARRVIDTAAAGNWEALVALGPELPRRATAARPIRAAASAFGRGLGRFSTTALRMRGGRGFSVALLGPDGAGKSTLSAGLVEHIGTALPTRLVYMGLWQGEEGQARSLMAAGLAAAGRPVKVWRRYLEARLHRALGRLVIFDRHAYDALLPPDPPLVWAKRLFFGFLAHAAPGPQLVLVLDLPSDVTIKRRPEEDPEHVRAMRGQYLALAERLPQAQLINGDQTPEAVRIEATARIWGAWAARHAKHAGTQTGERRRSVLSATG